jgi:hypothetical protein
MTVGRPSKRKRENLILVGSLTLQSLIALVPQFVLVLVLEICQPGNVQAPKSGLLQ